MSPELGRDVVALCAEIGRRAPSRRGPTPMPMPTSNGSARRPEVLVLGATGFIGRELARQLVAAGRPIRVLVRNPGRLPTDLAGPMVEVARGDAADPEAVGAALEGIDAVYHLARAGDAKTWDDFLRRDVRVTERLAEACLERGVRRLIYTGTIDSYYAGAGAGTITEATPTDPRIAGRNPYARAKAASEAILMALHRERGLPVVILRPGVVVGRGGSPLHWGVGMWAHDSVCRTWGPGTAGLPLVLVEDVAAALVRALEVEGIEGESFNLVGPQVVSAREYLAELERHAGLELQKRATPPWRFYAAGLARWAVKQAVRHPDRRLASYRDWESRTHRARYDCSRAERVLGWSPARDRDEIIRRGIHEPAAEFFA